MSDNLTTQSATPATIPASTIISTEEVTTLNAGAVTAQHVQRIAAAVRTADGTAIDLPGSTADGLLVNLGTNNDVTVTGTVTANLAAGTNNIGDVDVLTIAAGDNNIGNVDVVTLPALAAGTNNIGDVDVLTVPAPLSTTGGGLEATALRVTIASDSTGVLSIDDNAGSLTVDGTVTANLSATDNAVLDAIVAALPAALAAGGGLKVEGVAGGVAQPVSVATIPSHAVTNAGTFAVQATLADETTKVIGTVNISAAQTIAAVTAITNALPAGTNAIGKLAANSGVDIGDVDVLTMPGVVGTIADDATTPGAPVMIGGTAVETDGTDPTSVSAEADVARVRTDRNRRLLVNTAHPMLWRGNENNATAQTNNAIVAAPGAGLSLYVQTLIISNGATAGTVKLVEDTGGTPADLAGPYYFAINGGIAVNFEPPIRVTANKDLGYTSATVTTHTVTVLGYTAP